VLKKGRQIGMSFVNIDWPMAVGQAATGREPGKYDYSLIDGLLAVVAGQKIHASLVISRYREGAALEDAEYQEFLAALAAHLKERWEQTVAAVILSGTNEGAPQGGQVGSYGTLSEAYWKAWLQKQGLPERPWHSSDELRKAEPLDWPAIILAERCQQQWVQDSYEAMVGALKRGWPELTVQLLTADDDIHRLGLNGVFKARFRDLERLLALTENPTTLTDNPAAYQLLRSLGGERWLWHFNPHPALSTVTAFASTAAFLNDSVQIPQTNDTFLEAYNCGRDRQRAQTFQLTENAIYGYYLSMLRLREFEPVILNTWRPSAAIAVLYSQSTIRMDAPYVLQKNPILAGYAGALGWGLMLNRAHLRYDYLSEGDLATRLKSYRILVLPETQALPAAACATIREWVCGEGRCSAAALSGRTTKPGPLDREANWLICSARKSPTCGLWPQCVPTTSPRSGPWDAFTRLAPIRTGLTPTSRRRCG